MNNFLNTDERRKRMRQAFKSVEFKEVLVRVEELMNKNSDYWQKPYSLSKGGNRNGKHNN